MQGRILNIHGYRGSGKNSLYTALTKTGYDVITIDIDYDTLGAEKVMSVIENIIEREEVIGVSGTSLGGFFALCCSAKYQIPALLVNPGLLPELILPRLGYSRICGNREFTRVRAYLKTYRPGLLTTIIGDDDEVISDSSIKEYTKSIICGRRLITVPGGKHSGSTLGLEHLLLKNDILKEGGWLDVKDTKDETLR